MKAIGDNRADKPRRSKNKQKQDTHIPNAGKADVFDVRIAVLRGLAAGVLVRSKEGDRGRSRGVNDRSGIGVPLFSSSKMSCGKNARQTASCCASNGCCHTRYRDSLAKPRDGLRILAWMYAKPEGSFRRDS
jgi:hypothetical protein